MAGAYFRRAGFKKVRSPAFVPAWAVDRTGRLQRPEEVSDHRRGDDWRFGDVPFARAKLTCRCVKSPRVIITRAHACWLAAAPPTPVGAMANPKLTWTTRRRVNSKNLRSLAVKEFHEKS